MATAGSNIPALHGLARRLVSDGLIEADAAQEAQEKAAKQKTPLVNYLVENEMVQWVLDPDEVQQRRDRYLTIVLVAREETAESLEFSSRETNQPPVLPAWSLRTGLELETGPPLPPRFPTGPIDVPVNNPAFRTYSIALLLVGVAAGVLVGFLFLRRRR